MLIISLHDGHQITSHYPVEDAGDGTLIVHGIRNHMQHSANANAEGRYLIHKDQIKGAALHCSITNYNQNFCFGMWFPTTHHPPSVKVHALHLF